MKIIGIKIDKYHLDTDTQTNLIEDYALLDINNPENQTLPYLSLSSIPATANNIKLLNNWPQGATADILINGNLVYTLTLRWVQISNKDNRIELEIISPQRSLIDALSEIYLDQAEHFPNLSHTWSVDSIIAAQQNRLPYAYPLIDYGTLTNTLNTLDYSDFRPAIRIYELLLAVLNLSGYALSSRWLQFGLGNKLLLPSTTAQINHSDAWQSGYSAQLQMNVAWTFDGQNLDIPYNETRQGSSSPVNQSANAYIAAEAMRLTVNINSTQYNLPITWSIHINGNVVLQHNFSADYASSEDAITLNAGDTLTCSISGDNVLFNCRVLFTPSVAFIQGSLLRTSDYAPQLSITQLLKDLAQLANLYIRIADRVCYIEPTIDYLNGVDPIPIDLSSYTESAPDLRLTNNATNDTLILKYAYDNLAQIAVLQSGEKENVLAAPNFQLCTMGYSLSNTMPLPRVNMLRLVNNVVESTGIAVNPFLLIEAEPMSIATLSSAAYSSIQIGTESISQWRYAYSYLLLSAIADGQNLCFAPVPDPNYRGTTLTQSYYNQWFNLIRNSQLLRINLYDIPKQTLLNTWIRIPQVSGRVLLLGYADYDHSVCSCSITVLVPAV